MIDPVLLVWRYIMKRISFFFLLTAVLFASQPAASNTRTELARLQSDVLTLQNQLREIEKTFSERMDGLRSLVSQLNDQAAQSTIILNRIAYAIEDQEERSDGVLLDEIRRLTEKVDDFSIRISAMAQQLNEMRIQYRPMSQTGGAGADTMYNQAFGDFVQGNFELAIQGFSAYLELYPEDEKVPAALLNLGDSYSNQNQQQQAVDSYSMIINNFYQSDRVPSAFFKRARAKLAMQQRDSAITDLRSIVDKFPKSPESDLAKTELQKLGASQTQRR
jgi:TolA-binding protein